MLVLPKQVKHFIRKLFPWIVPLRQRYALLRTFNNYCQNGRSIYFANSAPRYSPDEYNEHLVFNHYYLVEDARRYLRDYNDTNKNVFLNRPVGKEILKILKQRSFDGPILDIGCGYGQWTRYLYELTGQRCVGLEVSPELVEVLNLHNPYDKISYVAGIIQKLPFADCSAGLVFVSSVVQYAWEFEEVIRELYRVSAKYVFIGRLCLFKHHESHLAYQDGIYRFWIRNYNEVVAIFSRYFEVVACDYSSEMYFVDNIDEAVICSHFLLAKKQNISKLDKARSSPVKLSP